MPAPVETSLLTHRIVEVPAPAPHEERPHSAGRARMVPSVAAVHALGRSVVCCWLRAKPFGRVAVLVGDLGGHASGAGVSPLPFPVGARGVAVSPATAAGAVDRLPHWRAADVVLDCRDEAADQDRAGVAIDDLFALLPDRPMALFSVARPLGWDATEQRVTDLSDQVGRLEARRSGRGSERVRLARAEAELGYLERWESCGLWTLRVWTAGRDAADCDAVAALLAGSGDLVEVPLRVRPGGRKSATHSQLDWGESAVVACDVVAALTRPPVRELPGIRVVAAPEFDLTPEAAGELALGAVLDATRSPAGPFGVTRDSVNRHVLVTGATGSGKSQTVRVLLEQLTARQVPWLVIEPAKSEYAAMAGRVAGTEVLVIRPGQVDAVPASLNPLEPSAITLAGRTVRFPLQTHVDLVRALFTASFEAQEPFPQLLAGALTRSYEDLGWNLTVGAAIEGATGAPPRWPTITDLRRQALAAIDEVGYGQEVRQNMRGFVRVRIDSLRNGTPGRFFTGGHPLDLEALLGRQVVFEIEDLGDDNDKAFFIGCVLIRLFELLRLRERHGVLPAGLAHVTVIEEAHRLLRHAPDGTPAAQAVTMFANLLAEIRAYGEGIVVAEQIPAKLVPDVVKNSAVKIMHRLPAQDDRDFVGATMNLSAPQSEAVVALQPGIAAAHADGMDRPVLVAVDGAGRARESTKDATFRAPVRSRSAACSRTCRTSPCTLGEIVHAENLPRVARIHLWAEIAVVAHLAGERLGRLSPVWAAELRAHPRSRLDCVLAAAVTAATDRRSRVIRRWYPPDDLARHVGDLLRDQLVNDVAVAVPDLRWRVAQYRWDEVLGALQAPKEPGRPHEMTAHWARHGLVVAGSTCARQLRDAVVQADRDWAAPGPALGGSPAVLNELAAAIEPSPDPVDQLERSVAVLGLETGWLAGRLRESLEETE
jgi:hypothetical protein